MDISYLLFLQDFRNGIHDALTPFMENLSKFGVTYIFLLLAFLYWSINKKNGLYVLASFVVSIGFNAVMKLTACVYRPWIRDSRIIPAGDSIKTAGGYSFPSGHTTTVTPIYGGFAVLSRKKIFAAFWILLILLTGFSRNYLGVHTPQDVLVGFVIGAASLYLVAKIFKYIDAHKDKENLFLLLGFLAGIIALLYATFKSYPMDYVDGKLIVDPKTMVRSSWGDISYIFGVTAGRYVEKRFIKFKSTGLNFKGIILSVLGLLILGFLIANFKSFAISIFGAYWGRLVNNFVLMFYIVAIWPCVIKLFNGGK